MAETARRADPIDVTPPVDPSAVDRAYREHRARRRARIERTRESRRANLRFWLVLLLLLTGLVALSLAVWNEIQQLFGL
jgi:hypothetical protein